jgi:hypothetical protein
MITKKEKSYLVWLAFASLPLKILIISFIYTGFSLFWSTTHPEYRSTVILISIIFLTIPLLAFISILSVIYAFWNTNIQIEQDKRILIITTKQLFFINSKITVPIQNIQKIYESISDTEYNQKVGRISKQYKIEYTDSTNKIKTYWIYDYVDDAEKILRVLNTNEHIQWVDNNTKQ